MTLSEIEETLRTSLKVHSVREIDNLPFESYEEIQTLFERDELQTETLLNENVIDLFGTSGQRAMDRILLNSPMLVIIASIVMAFVRSELVLLWGVAATVAAIIMTANWIKKFSSVVLLAAFATFIYFWTQGYFELTFLLGAYWVPNFLLKVSKEQNRLVLTEAAMSSELVFVYYYLRGEFVVSRK